MRKESTSLFTQISKEGLENLTSIVDETSATEITYPKSKKFTVADLWNIHKSWKQRKQRNYWEFQ